MRCPPAIEDEKARLQALAEYGLSEQEALPSLEPVVQIAARMLDMPVAAVNMIGSDHVFFAASVGIDEADMRRDVSFCAHAITQDEVMVVLDAKEDERFHDNPLVRAESGGIRFYAGAPLRSPSGQALGALCVIDSKPRESFSDTDRERLRDLARLASDKLELQRLENAKKAADARFEDVAANSPNAILCFAENQTITFWNLAAARMFGYAPEEITGKPIQAVMPALRGEALQEMLEHAMLNEPSTTQMEREHAVGRRKDGDAIPVEMGLFRWMQAGREQFAAILTDITERRLKEEQVYRLANFDSLTGLANRDLMYKRVSAELAAGEPTAVIAIGVDNFRDVSSTLGQSLGNKVLTTAAERMMQSMRPVDLVARTGGDEFAVLLPKMNDAERCWAMAETVMTALGRPMRVDGYEVSLAANCGIALSPMHGSEAEELMGNADLALSRAKADGRGRSFLYIPALRKEAAERRRYDAELHRAVENREFELFYQPQVRVSDHRVVGAEALIRWRHPEKGYLSPGEFLPALEHSPLAAAVGSWVLETACAQAEQWRGTEEQAFRMGVNLFAAQFFAGDLAEQVTETIARHGLPPDALELEITENIILNRGDLILDPLQRLREAGVCIAFDDFGTGYASLSLLKSYPLTRIKIDQTFIRGMCTSRGDAAIVSAAVTLARNYELEVIAEGVETEQQLGRLEQMECDEVQGYYFGRPAPASRFGEGLPISAAAQN